MQPVLIDPGHGGFDPGSCGIYKEKEINTAVAVNAAARLNAAGIPARLTHSGGGTGGKTPEDEIRIRCNMIKKMKPSLVVSVHCNGSVNNSAHGTEVLFYPGSSSALAMILKNRIIKALGTTDRGLKTGNFGMIRIPSNMGIPAALVEMGFITNPGEAKLMYNNVDHLGSEIAAGVAEFLNKEGLLVDQKYLDLVKAAQKFVIDNGISDGSRPADPVKREEIFIMLQNFYNKFIAK